MTPTGNPGAGHTLDPPRAVAWWARCFRAATAVPRPGAVTSVPRPRKGIVAKAKELPGLVSEFVDLAKSYVRQRTIEPAKALGRAAGLSFAAAFVFALAALFLAVAGMRLIVTALPDGQIWSGLGYILAAFGLLITVGLVAWRATR
jgi:hypothetical protein